ncbi:hypothetical protein BBJ28_00010989 [Nothophytophthora sp. Chile5]|nr:hypothetical protein BBJ28_00010989 [Nothophytophthora sp. Chile5]
MDTLRGSKREEICIESLVPYVMSLADWKCGDPPSKSSEAALLPKMKVVALVSGGKDSCYAMMECVRYGHELVCLAHLHPPAELSADAAEIDSFMFQSVGHNVVALMAESMELPLVTGAITGTALKTDIDYHVTTAGDEVEDLFRLLEDVTRQFPEVRGVCTGAIFSSYQRNRVENV